jgi:hypothetical protein
MTGIIIIIYIFSSITEAVGYNGENLLNLISVGDSDSLDQLRVKKLYRNNYIRVTAGLYKEGRDLDNDINVIIINNCNNIDLIILIILSVINIDL